MKTNETKPPYVTPSVKQFPLSGVSAQDQAELLRLARKASEFWDNETAFELSLLLDKIEGQASP